MQYPSDSFTYQYLAGPAETPEELDAGVTEGNCRYAIQLYFYRIHDVFLGKDDIYLPGGYKTLGSFVFKEETIDFDALKPGDIIYAQNLKNKNGDNIDKSLDFYKDKDEWRFHFHSAIYIGTIPGDTEHEYVWHATAVENGPALWPLEKFQTYYKPISVKRVL